MLTVMLTTFARTLNVKEMGAKGDGIHLDSDAINSAIATVAGEGGGTVLIPSGRYLCYSIRLASHVTLRMETGTVIVAAKAEEGRGYDVAERNAEPLYQDFGHSHWHNSLIWGENLQDVMICGGGLIDGRNMSRGLSRAGALDANKAIALRECIGVTLRDFQMLSCGHFALLATGVDNLTIDNVLVDTNRDGFDIDCCRNVRITQCSVNTPWDDAIVLKSSYALQRFRDTENVTISDCYVSGYDCGTLLDGTRRLDGPTAPDRGGRTGRIKLGTESSGGFRNIAITNCIFEHCRGLALETVDGGTLEDVVISNITMRHIVNAALFLRLGARMRSPEGTPVGRMRRVSISHVNAYDVDSRYSSIISGIPGSRIEDISLSDINIYYKGGIAATDGPTTIEQAAWEKSTYKEPSSAKKTVTPQGGSRKILERDTLLVVNLDAPVPEQVDSYPEPWMFGIVPAKGIFLRHIDGIRMRDVYFHFASDDVRPLVFKDDVEGLDWK